MAASSHARGGMIHGERRRLRRQPSLKVRPVELSQMRCIRGCRGRDWIVLPCIDVQGRDCVQVTVASAWLQHCLGARRQRGPWRGAVRGLLMECFNAFETSRESGHGDAPVEHNTPSKPPPGRKRVLDSDDEAELPPKGFEPRGGEGKRALKNGTSPSKGRRSKRGEFATLEVRDMKLTFTVLPGRKMYVPVEGKWLRLIIEHIARELPGDIGSGPDIASLLHKSDRPRIGWRAASPHSKYHGNWHMRCQAQHGTMRTHMAGFQVPRRALSGELYTASEALQAAKQVLHLVKKRWNEQDLSDFARFDV
jgi:hypothetical protein